MCSTCRPPRTAFPWRAVSCGPGWSTAAVDVDTATLLVSEVVTNAILHARTTVTLTVDVADDVVRITVRDGSPARHGCTPSRRHRPPAADCGCSTAWRRRWGVDADPVTGGKVVWFEVGEPAEPGWGDVAEARLRGTVPAGETGTEARASVSSAAATRDRLR